MMTRKVPQDHFENKQGAPATQGIINSHGEDDCNESGGWIEHERRKNAQRGLPNWVVTALMLPALVVVMRRRGTR